MTRRFAFRLCLLFASALLAGCAVWRPTSLPMRQIELRAACATRPDTLLVFLPGSYSSPEEFVREGFVARVRERRVAADIVLVDAHLGYYNERSIVGRLQGDVIAPAQAAGYRRIWLVGISIGAYGALLQAMAPPAAMSGVEGLVVIAPYLGDRRVSVSVDASGGLRAWPAPATPLPPNETDQTLWRWLQGYARGAERPGLFLGYGTSDRFEFSDRLLAAVLAPERVFAVPGGHTWAVWNALWRRMLPALPLPIDASCALDPSRQ